MIKLDAKKLHPPLSVQLMLASLISIVVAQLLPILLFNFVLGEWLAETVPQYSMMFLLVLGMNTAIFAAVFRLLLHPKLKYLASIRRQVQELGAKGAGAQLELKGHDELTALCETINVMSTELKMRFEKEREAERSKQELIMAVSHDLRTPLTSIKGYLQLLKEHGYQDETERDRYLDTACRQTETLARLVEELFAYTRLTDPEAKLELMPTGLDSLLRQVVMDYSLAFEQAGLCSKLEMPEEKCMAALAPDKFARVLQNLCQNILRYASRPGEAVFRLRKEPDGIRLTVANSAPPMPAADYARVFDRFYRAEKSRSHETGGTGLGLAIAKAVVEKHCGKIWAEEQEGKFAVCIWLPPPGRG